MNKYIFPIIKWKIKSWLKYYILNKSATSYPLSEITTGTSPLTLTNSIRKKFNIFNVNGNTIQDGTPTPESPIPVENVSGEVEVKVANGTDSTATGYEEQTATLHLPEGMEMCKSAYGEHTDDFIKQGDKWYKYKQNVKKRLLATNVNSMGGIDSTKGFIVLTGITNKLNSTSLWCNYFTNISLAGGEDNSNKIGIANINTDETLRFRYKTGELTLAGAREFLTNNEVILQYRLKTPVLEEITDPTLISDLESLKNLYSYKGTTHISSTNEPSPVFEVQYYMEEGEV